MKLVIFLKIFLSILLLHRKQVDGQPVQKHWYHCTTYDSIERDAEKFAEVIFRIKVQKLSIQLIVPYPLQANNFDEILLCLENVTFPERRITKGWYRARVPVEYLAIVECDFLAIDEAAFEGDTLATMWRLFLKYQRIFAISPLAFVGLAATDLDFINAAYCHKDIPLFHSSDTFHPIRRSVKSFKMCATLAGSIDHIFGAYKFPELNELHLENQKNLHILAYSNFTTFPALRLLYILNCGIRAIMPDAFDYIGVTLIMLQLTGNELKTLPAQVFNVFMENNVFTLIRSFIYENPWKCDCDMFESTHIVFHILKFTKIEQQIVDRSTINCTLAPPLDCSNIEALRPSKICLPAERATIFYPKFRLKINSDSHALRVAATVPRKYRLFVIDLTRKIQIQVKKPKCPTHNWLWDTTKCFIFNNQTESIPLHDMGHIQSEHRMIVLNYIAYRRQLTFWPLHSMIYGRGNDDDGIHMGWVVFLLAALIGSLVGIALVFVFPRKKTRESSIYETEYFLYIIPMEAPYDYAYDHMQKNVEAETVEYKELVKNKLEYIKNSSFSY